MWELTVILIVIAGIICYTIGYFSGKSGVDYYKKQVENLWEKNRKKDKKIKELKQKNRDMISEKNKKYKWKDE